MAIPHASTLRAFHGAAVDRERLEKLNRIVLTAVIAIGLSCIPNTVPGVRIDAPPRAARLLHSSGAKPRVLFV